MSALGSSSKWPSYDSLLSNSSFLHSESEHTEDETDAFSEGEADGGITKSLPAVDRLTLSAHYLQLAPLPHPHPRPRSEQTSEWPDRTQQILTVSSPSGPSFGVSPVTSGDLIFAQKCASLSRFIRPLLELLHGLKTGRFDKGLSSFQQSVAMDRLQRILGILQKPEMGEKYLRNLLQIEVMLKIWFPHVAFPSDAQKQTSIPRLPTQWHQNQLHIPVKKRKLSWSDDNHMVKVPATAQQLQRGPYEGCRATTTTRDTVSTLRPASPKKRNPHGKERAQSACGSHTAGFTTHPVTLSGLSYLRNQREGGDQPAVCDSPAGQDSAVSSSDTFTFQQVARI